MVADMKRMQFTAGQVWQRSDGLRYRLAGRTSLGWSVTTADSWQPWRFTDRHLHNLVCMERLQLIHEPPSVGSVVRRMQTAGLIRLAARLDVVGRTGKSDKRRRIREAQDAKQQIEEELETPQSPDSQDRLEDELEDVEELLLEDGPIVEDSDRVTSPNRISYPGVKEPNRVTRR